MSCAARDAAVRLLAAGALASLAACSVPWTVPFIGPSPNDLCRAATESMAAAVPPGESIAELQARGIRLRTPLRFAPGATPRPVQASGAAVRGLVAADGSVVPGSVRTLRSVGEPQVAVAMEAAVLSMSFEFDAGAAPGAPVPFTTVLVVCPRS